MKYSNNKNPQNTKSKSSDTSFLAKVLVYTILIAILIGAVITVVSNVSKSSNTLNQPLTSESSNAVTPTDADPTATTVDTSTVPQLGTYWYDATTDSIFIIFEDSYYSYVSIGNSIYDEGVYHIDVAVTDPTTAFYSTRHVKYMPFTYANGSLTFDGVTFTKYEYADFAGLYTEFNVRLNNLMIEAFENSENDPSPMYNGTAWQCVGTWLHAQEVIEFYSIDQNTVGMRRLSDGHETYNGAVTITTGSNYDFKVTYGENGENSFEFTFGQSGNSLIVSENDVITVYY